MKPISFYRAFPAGLLAVVGQVLTFYLRFGEWNRESPLTDYLFFFLAGSLGGLILIFFPNRQDSARGRWSVLVAFLLATPVALTLMIVGGLVGWPGALRFPLLPWALFAWPGAWGEKFISRG